MKLNRLFLPVFAVVLAGLDFWHVSSEDGARFLVDDSYAVERKKTEAMTAMCRKYSAVTPLAVSLRGKTLSVQGANAGVGSHAKQALPNSAVFVNGIVEDQPGYEAPTFVRSGPPADAFIVKVEERAVEEADKDNKPESGRRSVPASYHVVTVLDPTGTMIGQWQGFLNNSCPVAANRKVSLSAFFASKRTEVEYDLGRERRSRQLAMEIATVKTRYVARPEDFTVPASMPGCSATLIVENQDRGNLKTLQVSTAAGTVWFRYVREDQTLPVVACNDERTAILFRTFGGVSVVALDRKGNVLGSGRVNLPKSTAREIFRDAVIEKDNRVHAVLATFELDRKGTLVASEGRSLAATLGETPEVPKDAALELKLTRHTACAAPPALDTTVQVHEHPYAGVSWEYVQLPGQEPVPFTNFVVDAPLQKVAISFPDPRVQLVWLIQATPGTDLRYVEVSGKLPQTVLLKDSAAVVNVATQADCVRLFSRGSPSRQAFNIRTAYAKSGERETLNHVLMGNGHPFVSAEATRASVAAFGYQHFGSLGGYFMHLQGEGAVQEATPEDMQRFRNYYYAAMPLGKKIASWFKEDPALAIQGSGTSLPLLVKSAFPLPRHPDDDTYSTRFLLVDKGDPLPKGDLATYTILDANTLACPGRQQGCPWAKQAK